MTSRPVNEFVMKMKSQSSSDYRNSANITTTIPSPSSSITTSWECENETNEWIRKQLEEIDRVIFNGERMPQTFSKALAKECDQWREKFSSHVTIRTSFIESERTRDVLPPPFRSPIKANHLSAEHSKVRNLNPNSRDSQKTNFPYQSNRSQGILEPFMNRTQSGSASSCDSARTFDVDKESSVLTQATLEPLKVSASSEFDNIDTANGVKQKPLILPPLNSVTYPMDHHQHSVTKEEPRSSGAAFNARVLKSGKGFPSPPSFISINDVLSRKQGQNSQTQQYSDRISVNRISRNPVKQTSRNLDAFSRPHHLPTTTISSNTMKEVDATASSINVNKNKLGNDNTVTLIPVIKTPPRLNSSVLSSRTVYDRI